MGFTRFVEIGRVGLISYGPDMGKVCTIVNVIDHNRVLVDGPETVTGVHRHALSLKRLMLTDLKVNISLNATQKHAAAPRIRTPEPTARVGQWQEESTDAAVGSWLQMGCGRRTRCRANVGGRSGRGGAGKGGHRRAMALLAARGYPSAHG